MKISSAKLLKVLFIFCLILLSFIVLVVFTNSVFNTKKYSKIIDSNCEKYNLEQAFVLAVIKVESDFDENVVSDKGACGLMQIKPITFKYVVEMEKFNKNFDVFNPKDNITVGCAYLRYLINKFSSREVAICAFNAGEGNVSKWLKCKEYSIDGVNLDYIPFKETRNYLRKVNLYYRIYKRTV